MRNRPVAPWWWSCAALAWLAVPGWSGCTDSAREPAILTADMPLHLEDHLETATVVGSEVPGDLPETVEWRFDATQPDWRAAIPRPSPPGIRPATLSQTVDAVRISLGPGTADLRGRPVGGGYVEIPAWDHRDWSHVVIRARSSGPADMSLGFNVDSPGDARSNFGVTNPSPYDVRVGDVVRLVGDGTVQTYQVSLQPPPEWQKPIEQLGFWIRADDPLEVDILSITVLPMEAAYADAPVGMRTEERQNRYRRSLFMHTPAELAYRVQVPDEGRFDTGLGIVRSDPPTTFRVRVKVDGEPTDTLLEESARDRTTFAQYSVDLSAYAGQTVTLSLEASSARDGSVALWAVPTLAGSRPTDKPNVIFYVIDGGGADYMSVYGYNRRTTPNIERLAAEGAVFERVYSNAGWTRPSTASFMTSLQHSTLGGLRNGRNVVPDDVQTMAQHMHRAGYQTAVFTSNPNAGRMSGLDRGVDFMREAGVERDLISSVELHDEFWSWRDAYPAQPWWVHFQTTDVHEYEESGQPEPVPPFAGLFVAPETHRLHLEQWDRLEEWFGNNPNAGNRRSGTLVHTGFNGGRWRTAVFDETGIDRVGFFETMRSLYDESMAHQDYQIGRLVERLKAAGEWENTLLIIAADHSVMAALWDLGALLLDSPPPPWEWAMMRPSYTRVPLIVVWPGHIQGGQRFSQPVSMIDVLPTVLDLTGLPLPDVMQGQSLAPLLLGEGDIEPRPVILEEFALDNDTGQLQGFIEVIDGRWGASLEVNPFVEEQRPVRLLLFDLWNDPGVLHSVHEEYPELVEHYTAFLEARLEADKALGRHLTPGAALPLTPEQLQTLRSLGYIR